jgi:multidrug efflux pump subunit AcrA (membrane-fusion protein)
MALAALLVTGAYSVTAALGNASGGRANASATEQLIIDQRAKAQASYAAAEAQLSTLKPSRPVAELEALLAASSTQLRGRGCVVANGTGLLVCPRNAALAAELGRARRRAELEGKMEAAQAELERMAAPKQANSDAAALAGYLVALGLNIQIDAINRLLVLLAVLVVECGGGLALAVSLSLSEHREQRVRNQVFAEHPTTRTPRTPSRKESEHASNVRRTRWCSRLFGTVRVRARPSVRGL